MDKTKTRNVVVLKIRRKFSSHIVLLSFVIELCIVLFTVLLLFINYSISHSVKIWSSFLWFLILNFYSI